MKNQDPYFLDICFLDRAKAAAAAVGRIIRYSSVFGNSFMISKKLLLTNHHIIQDAEVAKISHVEFGYELDLDGFPKTTSKFNLAPDKFLITSPENDLDFTVVAVGDLVSGENRLSDFGFCTIKKSEDACFIGQFVNIIQHPGERFKKIVIRGGRVIAQSDEVLHYYSTVISGSSGSPVFNDLFEPIAIHHYGRPSRPAFTQNGKPGPEKIAEGIRISAIINRILSEKHKLTKQQRWLIDTALTSTEIT